jgi:uncharacterized protein
LILLNKLFFMLVAAVLWLAPAHAGMPTFPPLSGRVVDAAHILSADQNAALQAKLQGIETSTGHQLVVTTIPDLQGRDIADYGYQLGRNWGIGTKGKNDGAIIIVAPNDHKVRIEVGYGLEPIVTDGLSSVIISTKIIPAFKAGDTLGGINAGVDALADVLKLPPDEAAARAKALVAANQAEQSAHSGRGIGPLIPILLFLLFFVLPMFRRRSGYGYGGGMASGLGQVALWSMLGSGRDYGGGGSFGGGGGDSFSGGGGSFGGGGASGSW